MNTIKKQGNNKGVGKEAWYANLEKGRWRKGQSWNPKGRKPKTFAGEAKQLRDQGHENVTTGSIQEAFQMLIWMNRAKLIEIAIDESLPYTFCAVAKWMLSDKYGMRIIDKIFDRLYGKPSKQLDRIKDKSFTLADGLLALRDKKQKS